MSSQISSLSFDESTSAGRKITQLIQALEEVEILQSVNQSISPSVSQYGFQSVNQSTSPSISQYGFQSVN